MAQVEPRREAGSAPAPAEVRVQVDRILSSPAFEASQRARRFLTYIVEEKLAGRADRIKAYSVAIEVFGRDSSFDAQSDPVVRIEAGRIRRSLEHYYLVSGQSDPILITIPKGRYIPVFEKRLTMPRPMSEESVGAPAAVERPAPPTRPALREILIGFAIILLFSAAILLARDILITDHGSVPLEGDRAIAAVPQLTVAPFTDLGGSPHSAAIARGLTDEIIGRLSWFNDLKVAIGGTKSVPVADEIARAEASYVLYGSVSLGVDKIHLIVRLENATDQSVVWSQIYERPTKARDVFELQGMIAKEVATALGQPYGIIQQAAGQGIGSPPPDDWEAYSCTLSYYAYRAELRPEKHQGMVQCLEQTVARFPSYATAWALLSLTYLDEFRFRYRIRATGPPPIERALETSTQALRLDPRNVRALEAKMLALFFSGEPDEALRMGERALALNPQDTYILGEYGSRLGLTGQWAGGADLLMEAIERNPGPPGYYTVPLALSFFMRGEIPAAIRWIETDPLVANPGYHLVAAAIYGEAGMTGKAARERDWLLTNAPMMIKEVHEELDRRNVRPLDQERWIGGLRKAGLPVFEAAE